MTKSSTPVNGLLEGFRFVVSKSALIVVNNELERFGSFALYIPPNYGSMLNWRDIPIPVPVLNHQPFIPVLILDIQRMYSKRCDQFSRWIHKKTMHASGLRGCALP